MTAALSGHHKIFSRFRPWSGNVPAGFVVDFLGTRSRTDYFTMLRQELNSPCYPAIDEEYFEWIDLLESVASARNRFTMLELGAGWGRWTARGAAAAAQLGLPYTLVAVEAEPTHFEWLKENLKDNHVRLENCRLVQAAVTASDGSVGFHVGDPAECYGQSIGGPVQVPAVSLETLLAPLDIVDFIDMDIQGAELEVLLAARESMQRKVKRVHVGTHSARLHKEIASLFTELGWRWHVLFKGNMRDKTRFGRINFQDGVQSWLNTALHTEEELSMVGAFQNSLGFRGLEAGRAIVERLAPIGTTRRNVVRAVFSPLAGMFRRDAEEEKLRPGG